ncbi:unnamed protein product [Darwinula stevensoni]|uniref:Failed axon connections n=1 Tax=Darwinula stevensoni TaxID=69355 RepID=A0A7R9A2I8_9CRUS|nr:unnamed protein product [Darwinula stevensoni]CAG0879610.1 unnamed protein product [Darwinula stevensoni]
MGNEGENQNQTNAESKEEKPEEKKEEKPLKEEEKKKDEKEKPKKEEKDKKETKSQAIKPAVHKEDYEEDVVYLYQFSRTPVIPSLSPFCLKVETWLRMAGLKYQNVDHKMKLRSKKGQLPFVEFNGQEIADSALIIKELGKKFNKDLDTDAGLESTQKCTAHTTIAMIENHLFWVLYWWRSKNPGQLLKGSKFNLQQALGSKMPNGLLSFVFKWKFRQGQKRVRAHGLGVHTSKEIEEFGQSDLQVLSDLLGEKDFFFGDKPALLDVVAFSVLAQFLFFDKDTPFPLRTWLEENTPNLQAFVNRMKDRYYPDWDEMCKTLDLNTHLPKPPPEEKEEKEDKDKKEEKKEEKADEKEEEKKEEEKKE